MGFQSIRLCPTLHMSGVHWVAWFTGACNVRNSNAAELHPKIFKHFIDLGQPYGENSADTPAACYISPQQFQYFEWEDAENDSPQHLAKRFISRFPRIAKDGNSSDPDYVEWYRDSVHKTKPEGIFSIYESASDTGLKADGFLYVLGHSSVQTVDSPPPPVARSNG